MKFSEIYEFNQTNKHLIVEGSFNEEYSFGQEWDDVPFEDVRNIVICTHETFVSGKNTVEPTVSRYSEEQIEKLVEKYQSSVPLFSKKDWYQLWSRDNWYFDKELPDSATWEDIFNTLDNLIDESGDHHHIFPERIRKIDDYLYVELGS